jgi:predicted acylesterase/phospholipase RssA
MTDVAEDRWAAWGHLADRYRDEDRAHRILALDGGGIRGVLTLGVLEALEDRLRESEGRGSDGYRLCDFFDLIGGTSTGAIIAAGLARGMSVREISDFYARFADTAFRPRKLWNRWQTLFGEGGLARTLRDTFGHETTLHPEHLRCLMIVVTRNATTDSAWPISSNPAAKYNDLSRADCNLKIPLWQLVRASTAAPVYFPPEVVSWDPADDDKSFVFVDGGTTPYNNPAFLLFRMATEPAYRLSWPTGEDKLLVVSVGTGGAPVLGDTAGDPGTNLIEAATNTLSALMSQASVDQDVNCRVLGRCAYGLPIDREVGALVRDELAEGGDRTDGRPDRPKLFRYVRYNATLTDEGMADLALTGFDPTALRRMDRVENVDALTTIGRRVGEEVTLQHLGPFVTDR